MVSDEEVTVDVEETESLNPCSNGIWSLTIFYMIMMSLANKS